MFNELESEVLQNVDTGIQSAQSIVEIAKLIKELLQQATKKRNALTQVQLNFNNLFNFAIQETEIPCSLHHELSRSFYQDIQQSVQIKYNQVIENLANLIAHIENFINLIEVKIDIPEFLYNTIRQIASELNNAFNEAQQIITHIDLLITQQKDLNEIDQCLETKEEKLFIQVFIKLFEETIFPNKLLSFATHELACKKAALQLAVCEYPYIINHLTDKSIAAFAVTAVKHLFYYIKSESSKKQSQQEFTQLLQNPQQLIIEGVVKGHRKQSVKIQTKSQEKYYASALLNKNQLQLNKFPVPETIQTKSQKHRQSQQRQNSMRQSLQAYHQYLITIALTNAIVHERLNTLKNIRPVVNPKMDRTKETKTTQIVSGNIIYRINRAILEKYANLHRLGQKPATGSLSAYIKAKYYPHLKTDQKIIVNASKLQLQGINLINADLSGTNFSGADLSNATLNGADLSNAKFEKAILKNASLINVIRNNTNFTNADLFNCITNVQRKRRKSKEIARMLADAEWKKNLIKQISYNTQQLNVLYKLFIGKFLTITEKRTLYPKLLMSYNRMNQLDRNDPLHSDNWRCQTVNGLPHINHSLEQLDKNFEKIKNTFLKSDQFHFIIETLHIILDLINQLIKQNLLSPDEKERIIIQIASRRNELMQWQFQYFLYDLDKLSKKDSTNTPENRSTLIRRYIETAQQTMHGWQENSDAYKIDITEIDLKQCDLSNMNFHNIKVTPEQLSEAQNIHTIRIDEAILIKAQQIKKSDCEELLERTMQTILYAENMIQVLSKLIILHIEGQAPELDELTLQELKYITYLALTSYHINLLPQAHPLHCSNIQSKDLEEIFKNKTRVAIEQDLLEMLEVRNYQLSREVIYRAQSLKVDHFFASISDTFIDIADIEKLLCELLPEDQKNLTAKIDEIKFKKNEILARQQQIMQEYDQRFIAYTLDHLYDASDEALGFDSTDRLQCVIDSAKAKSMPLNLTSLQLDGIDFKQIEFHGILVKLTLQQAKKYLTNKQKIERFEILCDAIKNRDLQMIQKCIQHGIDINEAHPETSRTPLMTACALNQFQSVRHLLAQGANIHAKTPSGWEIIEYLCRDTEHHIHQNIIELLVKNGAIIDIHSATALGHLEILETTTQKNIKQINQLKHEEAPIHIAALLHRDSALALLLKYQANVSLKTYNQRTALHIACWQKPLDDTRLINIVRLLLLSDINLITIPDKDGKLPLLIAAETGHRKICELLIEAGAEIDIASAIILYKPSVIKACINKYNNPNLAIECAMADSLPDFQRKKIPNQNTLLYFAVKHKNADSVCCLLAEGSDPMQLNKWEETAFDIACEKGLTQIIELFLDKIKIDLNQLNKNGETALHVAVKGNYTTVANLLLKQNADPNIYTSIHHTTFGGESHYIKQTALHIATRRQNIEMIKLLLNYGAKATLEDNDNNLPLHIASELGNAKIVTLLLEAYYSIKNKAGKTARELARIKKHQAVEKILCIQTPQETKLIKQPLFGQADPGLTQEITLKIFSYLEQPSSISVMQVCNLWYGIVKTARENQPTKQSYGSTTYQQLLKTFFKTYPSEAENQFEKEFTELHQMLNQPEPEENQADSTVFSSSATDSDDSDLEIEENESNFVSVTL